LAHHVLHDFGGPLLLQVHLILISYTSHLHLGCVCVGGGGGAGGKGRGTNHTKRGGLVTSLVGGRLLVRNTVYRGVCLYLWCGGKGGG
jgi:hypothetical protein